MTSYKVDGMTCNGCATSVTKAIKSAAGNVAAEVSVDLEAHTVSVSGFDNAAVIERAVEDAGFDFGGPA